MSVLDPFGLTPGIQSGRIQPVGWTAPDGDWVLSLGQDTSGLRRKFNIGDRVEYQQTADLGGAKLIRMRVRLRGPADITPGAFWAFSVLVDDVEKYRATMKDSRRRDLSDIIINVAGLVGLHKLQLRLSLVSS